MPQFYARVFNLHEYWLILRQQEHWDFLMRGKGDSSETGSLEDDIEDVISVFTRNESSVYNLTLTFWLDILNFLHLTIRHLHCYLLTTLIRHWLGKIKHNCCQAKLIRNVYHVSGAHLWVPRIAIFKSQFIADLTGLQPYNTDSPPNFNPVPNTKFLKNYFCIASRQKHY